MNRCVITLLLTFVAAGCGNHGAVPPATTMPTAPGVPTASPNVILRGSVYNTAYRPVDGATVTIVDGSQSGTSTTTKGGGAFEFSGAPFVGSVTLRATKEGYAAATATGNIPTGSSTYFGFTFQLESLAPPVNVSGDYSLTFTADSVCADLPDEVRTRTYEATITPSPTNKSFFYVAVHGASFFGSYNTFAIGVAGNNVTFLVDFDGPVIVEQLAPRTYLAIDGLAEASVGTPLASMISAPFDGVIDYCILKTESGAHYSGCGPIPDQAVTHAQCISKNHRLTLTRR